MVKIDILRSASYRRYLVSFSVRLIRCPRQRMIRESISSFLDYPNWSSNDKFQMYHR